MANRAYLYSTNDCSWETPEQEYYDSRWAIPLAWYFFFRPDDVRLVPICDRQEAKLAAQKDTALQLFKERLPQFLSLATGRISSNSTSEFISIIASRPGCFLQLDPAEVFGGMYEDDLSNAEKLRQITARISDQPWDADDFVRIARPFAGRLDSDPVTVECSLLGFTYW